jgi:hypothetical protein
MTEESRREVRAGLERCLTRLWRYALVLSKAEDAAEDLVQATCVRAIERAEWVQIFVCTACGQLACAKKSRPPLERLKSLLQLS